MKIYLAVDRLLLLSLMILVSLKISGSGPTPAAVHDDTGKLHHSHAGCSSDGRSEVCLLGMLDPHIRHILSLRLGIAILPRRAVFSYMYL